MVSHNITVGRSTIYKSEGGFRDSMSQSGQSEILEYLVSTPAMMSIIIDAASSLLDPLLPEDYITVGKNIELDHHKPTIIDSDITIIISVTKVDGDKVYLDITGHDSIGIVCQGKYERVIVNKNTLLDSAYRRAQRASEL